MLVEEYGALAVAIGSALKKFAPGFATKTVRSLADAETAIATAKPDLLVIDFDPPTSGALEFFMRLKSSAPSTRVLVIAAAPLSRLAAFAAAPGAFQFVDKPFDLTTLGMGVEAVLGTGGHGQRTRRTLRDLAVRDVIPLQCLSDVTGILKIDASEGRAGEIHFIDGQISHAETTETDGPEALREMLRWPSPRFKQPKRKPRAAKTIEGNWSAVLLDAASNAAAEGDEPLMAERAMPLRESVGGGNKIVVIDDTDMLLVFVEDILATADPTLEIFTAATGADGVDRVAAIKPRLVLLDFSLPDFNGDEVCKRLLANAATASIPVIMMSGHVPEMAASALRYENIVATIAKPFLSEALVDIVTKALADPGQFAVRPPAPPAATPQLPPAEVTAAAASDAPPKAVQPAAKPTETLPTQAPARTNGHRRSDASPAESSPEPPSTAQATGVPAPPATAPPPPAPAASPSPAPSALMSPPTAPAPLFSGPGGGQKTAVAPPPPLSVIAPAPRPTVQRAPAAVAAAKPLAQQSTSSVAAVPQITAAAPARLAFATTNAVVIGVALEVLAIQFSPTLQMAAIRARPASRTISLHVEAGALPSINLPEAGFELGPVKLDARGQIDTVRLLPTTQRIGALPTHHAFPVGAVSVLPWNGGKAVELTPSAAAPMMMLLSAPFELAGVELSAGFGVGALVLKARAGQIRVSLEREAAQSGAAFQTAQVLLNRSAQIAEILLDAVA